MSDAARPVESVAAQMEAIAAEVRAYWQEKSAARDRALANGREAIRHCANAIRAVHRHDHQGAEELLAHARALLEETAAALQGHADILHAGYVEDAQKEYAEARITLALVSGGRLPTPQTLGVTPAAYMNGAAEAVGELRRYILDLLRRGEPERCEQLLEAMDDIYATLVTMDFPDAMTGGLRRSTDNARGILERTRGDLTMALVQQAVQRRLEQLAGG